MSNPTDAQFTHPQTTDVLARGAAELGLELTAHQLGQFDIYLRELADWNKRFNLTSITEPTEVVVKHFLDSLTVCLAYPKGMPPSLRLVDVGTGAGFPGIPLKLAFPDYQICLVESVRKKARFLEHLVELLALSSVEVLTGRAEDLAYRPELRESFDLVLGRGVAQLSALLEYTLPFCAVGGRLVAQKHGGIEQEITAAARALVELGGRLGEVHQVGVTGLTDDRLVVVVEKTSKTPDKYPRRPGIPAKRPL